MTLQPWNRHGMPKVDLRSRLVSPPVDGKRLLLLRVFVFSSAHYYVCTMKSEPLKRTLYLSYYHSELCAASSNTWNQKIQLSHDFNFKTGHMEISLNKTVKNSALIFPAKLWKKGFQWHYRFQYFEDVLSLRLCQPSNLTGWS